jgi:hypothetical protein
MGVVRAVFLASLIWFLVPVVVWGQDRGDYVTVWFDDFLDAPNASERERDDSPWRTDEYSEYRIENERGGFYFVSLLPSITRGWGGPGRLFCDSSYLYVGVEFVLRCSEDDWLTPAEGPRNPPRNVTIREWGFCSGPRFAHYSTKDAEPYTGLWAEVFDGSDVLVMREPIEGVDITDWHTYSIFWEPGKVDFLIDGGIVATTNKTRPVRCGQFSRFPAAAGGLNADFGNILDPSHIYSFLPCQHGEYGLVSGSWIQVDSVRLLASPGLVADMFYDAESRMAGIKELVSEARMVNLTNRHRIASEAWTKGDYVNALLSLGVLIEMCDVPRLLSCAFDALLDMEKRGHDIGEASNAYHSFTNTWVRGCHEITPDGWWCDTIELKRICGLRGITAWHDILCNDLFAQARHNIEAARASGENTEAMEYYYIQALGRWDAAEGPPKEWHKYYESKNYLDKIPEPALLPILGLIPLPALLRRGRTEVRSIP